MNSLPLSKDAIQRGSFLDERKAQGKVACYDSQFDQLMSRLSDCTIDSLDIRETADSLERKVDEKKIATPPIWWCFSSKLIEEKRKLCTLPNDLLEQIAIYAITEPYAAPFINTAIVFAEALYETIKKSSASECVDGVALTVTKWYVSSLIDAARYVLHLQYKRSGLNYQEWCKRFEVSTNSNPWYEIGIEFPVLIRWLATITTNCNKNIHDFFFRLSEDKPALEQFFSLKTGVRLSSLTLGLSDPHRGGKQVIKTTFCDGKSLYYKPRSLGLEQAFARFVNRVGAEYGLIELKVFNQEHYGWMEDAHTKLSITSRELEPYSAGYSAALFWLINSTDLHIENVLPSSEGVCALDLETLVSPQAYHARDNASPHWRQHNIYTTMLFNYSVGEGADQDISGFNPEEQLGPKGRRAKFVLVDDDIQLVYEDKSESSLVRRSYENDLIEKLIQSFSETAKNHRHEIEDILLSRIPEFAELRVVFRDTYFYSKILDRTRQPRFLRDAAHLQLDLMSLYEGVPERLANRDKYNRIVESEIKQLMLGDIPYFSSRFGKKELYFEQGSIRNFFHNSALDNAKNKIRNIEQSDIAEQTALISISLGAKNPQNNLNKSKVVEVETISQALLLSYANNLMKSAFGPANFPARWISMYGDVSEHSLRIGVGDNSLFGGSWGILLSIQAILSVCTNNPECSKLHSFLDDQANKWSQYAFEVLYQRNDSAIGLLGFTGLGGEIFAQSTLLSLDDQRWGFLEEVIGKSLKSINNEVDNDEWQDVIGGVAGLALACEHFLSNQSRNEWTDIADFTFRKCAKRLVESASTSEYGLAWIVKDESSPLLSYAHGWAGIVCALHAADQRYGIKEISNTIQQAAMFPHNLLKKNGQWSDLRTGLPDKTPLNGSWCNGLSGVLRGLSVIERYWTNRVHAQSILETDKMMSSLGSGSAYRFCCGEMGKLDYIIDYLRTNPDRKTPALEHSIKTIGTSSLNSIAGASAEPPELNFPGLYQGQSGILYTLARLFLPDLPSLSGQSVPRQRKLDILSVNNLESSAKLAAPRRR